MKSLRIFLILPSIMGFFAPAFLCVAAHAVSTEKLYLSGRDKDHTVDWQFLCASGRKSGSWTTIPVPPN